MAELGCVFKTDFGDANGAEIWVASHYEPGERIAFVRTGAHHRTTRYEISLAPVEEGISILWQQEITGLTPEGDRLLAVFPEEEFKTQMIRLNRMLDHYLVTGEPLILPDD